MRATAVRGVVMMLVLVGLLAPAGSAAAGTGSPASADIPIAAAGLTVTARFALLVDGGAAVVLVGQYACGPFSSGAPDRGVIDLSIAQRVGGVDVNGFGFLTPAVCDATAQWFAAALTTSGGTRFRRASANWSASGYVEGDTGVQNVHVPPTSIRIQ